MVGMTDAMWSSSGSTCDVIGFNRASLAIHSERLSRDEITQRLGIDPSPTKKRTSADRAVGRLTCRMTPRESGDETGAGSVRRLVEMLAPNLDAIDALRADCDVRIWWSGDSDSTQGGFVLRADLLAFLGSLNIDVFGTVFVDGESDEER